MSVLPFPNLDHETLSGLSGRWGGCRDAMGLAHANVVTAVGATSDWQGARAVAFNHWWESAGQDMMTLVSVADTMSQALGWLASMASDFNAKVNMASMAIASNTTPYPVHGVLPGEVLQFQTSVPGAQQFPDGKPLIWVLPPWDSDASSLGQPVDWVNPQGHILPGPAPNISGLSKPEWMTNANALLQQAYEEYVSVSKQASTNIEIAIGQLKSTRQLHEIAGTSHLLISPTQMGPVNADGTPADPIWNQLTDGTVLKPTVPPGFDSSLFTPKLLPDWYTHGESDIRRLGRLAKSPWAEPIVDAFAVATALVGAPEVGTAMIMSLSETKSAFDASNKDWRALASDGASLLLSITPGVNPADIADEAAKTIAAALLQKEGIASTAVGAVSGNLVDYIRGQLQEKLIVQGGEAKISVADMQQIADQASGEAQTLQAAGVPPNAAGAYVPRHGPDGG